MEDLEIIQGVISAVVYHNYENGYAVLRLHTTNDQTVTVVGTIPMPSVGERLMVTGKWSSHSSYGKQFEAEFLERLMPETAVQIMAYLSGRVIKGIGPKMAAKIVDRFGDKTLTIIEKEPEKLAEVSGISLTKAKSIGEEFRLQVGMRHLMEFFALHQLPAELAVKVYKLYGESAIDMLYDDPYLLMEQELEAPFGAVDRFAIELGIAGNDPKRINAGILFELRYNLNAGHAFLPENKLCTATAQLLSIDPEAVQACMQRLLQTEQIVKDHLAGIDIIYLPELYEAEIYTKERLHDLSKSHFPAPLRLERFVKYATSGDFQYSQQQEDAIRTAATTGLLLITGGPGTGKTTIINGILALFDKMGVKSLLAAPTGRAAKRLSEVTGEDASTIHRLLEATVDPHTGNLVFLRDEDNQLKSDAIIIDEMSMVDIQLLHALLRAIPKGTRLILVGDPDQLPPVGPGFPFSDMLRSKSLPAVYLTEIFRQAQQSLIVTNAHKVNKGILPELHNVKNDFFFLNARSEDAVAQTIVGLCATRLPQKMGITADQIQVLSPTKKGMAGTVNLNKILQDALNPASAEKKERKFGEYTFREGDRVMQIRNNYDIMWKKEDGTMVGTGVFNGDIGIITEIDP